MMFISLRLARWDRNDGPGYSFTFIHVIACYIYFSIDSNILNKSVTSDVLMEIENLV